MSLSSFHISEIGIALPLKKKVFLSSKGKLSSSGLVSVRNFISVGVEFGKPSIISKKLVEPWSPAASDPGNPTPRSTETHDTGTFPGSNSPDNGRRMPMEEGFGCPPHRTTSGVECTAMAVRDAGLTIFSRFFPLCRWR